MFRDSSGLLSDLCFLCQRSGDLDSHSKKEYPSNNMSNNQQMHKCILAQSQYNTYKLVKMLLNKTLR